MRINQSKSATTGADFRNGMVKRVKLSQHAKFHGDRYNHRRDIAIFRLFKMAVAAIMDFLIFDFLKFLTVGWLKMDGTVPNFVDIGQTAAQIWRFFDFSR